MALVSLQEVSISFGAKTLLENVDLQIEPNERICILGRNGSGKSTLLRLIAKDLSPDSGDMQRKVGLRISSLVQTVPENLEGTLLDVVMAGSRIDGDNGVAEEEKSSAADLWELEQQAKVMISRMDLDPAVRVESLSAGMKRRVLLAGALARDPDILLLDEPTNHLDLASITWMEDFLQRYSKTIVFVTHDRALLRRLANRIVEIDRGRLFSWACDYDTFLKRRQAEMEAEENRWRVFDKKLAQEEAWIRQGIKARRTRNEGRVRALERMREERRQRREKSGNAQLLLQSSEKSGRLVIETKELRFTYGDTPVVDALSTKVMRGDKIGLIGPNGAGKSTLVKLLLKELSPQDGSVKHGTRLQVAYFDQLRENLDLDKSVQDNVADGNDTITFNGRQRHIIGYLQDFLFSPERARTPVRVLSGGEKNRLMLAKLFTRPFNLLVMDEPTNDLDLETLELLEELLFDYPGTLLLVSHDREFINRVVTSTLVFEGDGRITEYAGGYDDYLLQKPKIAKSAVTTVKKGKDSGGEKKKSAQTKRKLGYMQQRELEELPQRIESLENRQKKLYEILSDPLFYRREKEEIARFKEEMVSVEDEIKQAYERWEELEAYSAE